MAVSEPDRLRRRVAKLALENRVLTTLLFKLASEGMILRLELAETEDNLRSCEIAQAALARARMRGVA